MAPYILKNSGPIHMTKTPTVPQKGNVQPACTRTTLRGTNMLLLSSWKRSNTHTLDRDNYLRPTVLNIHFLFILILNKLTLDIHEHPANLNTRQYIYCTLTHFVPQKILGTHPQGERESV